MMLSKQLKQMQFWIIGAEQGVYVERKTQTSKAKQQFSKKYGDMTVDRVVLFSIYMESCC